MKKIFSITTLLVLSMFLTGAVIKESKQGESIEFYTNESGTVTKKAEITAAGVFETVGDLKTDTINESSSGVGVTVDGSLIKDGSFSGDITGDSATTSDSTVVRTTGDQSIGGTKTFTSNVGIGGTPISSYKLEVREADAIVAISGGVGGTDTTSELRLTAGTTASGVVNHGSVIASSSASGETQLDFHTAISSAEASRMTIKAGNVGIGTTSPSGALLDISRGTTSGTVALKLGADTTGSTRTDSTSKQFSVIMPHYDNDDEDITIIRGFSDGGTSNNIIIGGSVSALNAATGIQFYTAATPTTRTGTARMTIDSSGLATFNNGINFGESTLSSYKTDSWTPVVKFGTTAATLTSLGANYTRVGNMVTLMARFVISDLNGGTGAMTIENLPHDPINYCVIPIGTNKMTYVFEGPHVISLTPGSTTASIKSLRSSTSTSSDSITDSNVSAGGSQISMSITYLI